MSEKTIEYIKILMDVSGLRAVTVMIYFPMLPKFSTLRIFLSVFKIA